MSGYVAASEDEGGAQVVGCGYPDNILLKLCEITVPVGCY